MQKQIRTTIVDIVLAIIFSREVAMLSPGEESPVQRRKELSVCQEGAIVNKGMITACIYQKLLVACYPAGPVIRREDQDDFATS